MDMDDVLLACSQYVIDWHGKKSPFDKPENCGTRDIHTSLGMSWEDCWNNLPEIFWKTVPFCPWGRGLVELAERYFPGEVYLLTSPIPNGVSSSGKQLWVNTHMPEYKNRMIIGHKKHVCVADDGILIDDSYLNEEKFAEYNKSDSFFLFPSYMNRLWGVMDSLHNNPQLAIDLVEEKLLSYKGE